MNHPELIYPDWSAPASVVAATTTRQWGFHKLDSAPETRLQRLQQALDLPEAPRLLRQVHGTDVIAAQTNSPITPAVADASYSLTPNVVCAVQTADCLPILLCHRHTSIVAAIHAGWRSLQAGILDHVFQAIPEQPSQLLAWLGPAISAEVYEVGDEVRAAFLDAERAPETAFVPSPAGRWLFDLYATARWQLRRAGLETVYGGEFCTLSDAQRFHSYRREGSGGRMLSLICWRH